ncbi:uncharacterized protein [Rutidosis leptorrhynchoides]|uniref:uncharacterized protein n=1 Tax=Rutidosis leptorrhynchoides TaxID=125765 RepID=UPI003A9A2B11
MVPLASFTSESTWSTGSVILKVILEEYPYSRSSKIEFLVVKEDSPYNIILGRTAMQKFGAITSTVHGMMKFTTPADIATLYGVKRKTIECKQVSKKKVEFKVHDDGSISPNTKFPEYRIAIGKTLSKESKNMIGEILATNIDVFAWKESDMTGVPSDVTEHKLDVNPNILPVCQKKRGMAPERHKCLKEEVDKLVKAGIMREVKYQIWVANPVMVKKPDGSWRMCLDFTDINKANVEAYVDDIVIKSCTEDEIMKGILEIFNSIRKINMKLNLKKFTFEVEEGKFLGYMVTPRGIKANPKKIQAIEDMKSPSSKKEVQSLNGKLAALTRFLLKAAKRSVPFFSVLKGCINQKDFSWTTEVEATFHDIKKLLKELLTLTTPMKKKS